jgi:CYTH domain-containing protein
MNAMAKEIERKFLVTGDGWRAGHGSDYRQGYLSIDPERTVRVRVAGTTAQLTIKGLTEGATRAEYEYPVPLAEANIMLDTLCLHPLIEKRRYRIEHRGMIWEVDEFRGDNAGLVVAEIELDDEHQPFEKPDWIGDEVTSDPRFYNANLVSRPYRSWEGKPASP